MKLIEYFLWNTMEKKNPLANRTLFWRIYFWYCERYCAESFHLVSKISPYNDAPLGSSPICCYVLCSLRAGRSFVLVMTTSKKSKIAAPADALGVYNKTLFSPAQSKRHNRGHCNMWGLMTLHHKLFLFSHIILVMTMQEVKSWVKSSNCLLNIKYGYFACY